MAKLFLPFLVIVYDTVSKHIGACMNLQHCVVFELKKSWHMDDKEKQHHHAKRKPKYSFEIEVFISWFLMCFNELNCILCSVIMMKKLG